MSWFQLPSDVSSISVERQSFKPEFKDDNNNRYFRAPEHFAAQILGMNIGIKQVAPGEGWPEDIPRREVGEAIDTLGLTVSNLQDENKKLREMLSAVVRERDDIKIAHADLLKQITELKQAPPVQVSAPAEINEPKKK